MDDQTFADGIGAIAVVGTTVRIDFFALSPSERDANGKPKPIMQRRLIMTVEGFLHAAGKMQEVAEAISKIGAQRLSESQNSAVSRAGSRKAGASGASPTAPSKSGDRKPPFP
jgi:hypothetical protein